MEPVWCLNISVSVVSVLQGMLGIYGNWSRDKNTPFLAKFKETIKGNVTLKNKETIALFCTPLADLWYHEEILLPSIL